jgi:hypothetical protein
MRKAYDSEFLFDDNGKFYGICLGADFCAEHEWGIAGLRNTFGVDHGEEKIGAAKTKTTKVPKNGFGFFEVKNGAILAKYPAYWDERNNQVNEIVRCARFGQNCVLECAWDEGDFAIYVDKNHVDYLKQLHVAFHENDVTFLSANQLMKNGLVLAIYSALPKTLKEELINKDRGHRQLLEAAEKTGIVKYLNKHGFSKYGNPGWYALKPAWDRKGRSEEGIIFWLNPTEQHIHNFGWFTVEELKQWPHGKGPIPKKNNVEKEVKPNVVVKDKTT